MIFLRIALAVSFLFVFPLSSLSAEPQGELYWMVDSDLVHVTPQDTISLYNPSAPPNPFDGAITYGAWESIDKACSIYTENGTYRFDDDKPEINTILKMY